MSSHERTEVSPAERSFRDAFDRLKAGVTRVLPPGSPITQNNVAREAGCDPSALRKSRYPSLIGEIQCWVAETARESILKSTQRVRSMVERRSLRQRMLDLKKQRDVALSLLVQADAKILELTQEIEDLRSSANSPLQMHLQKKT
jgi:hypothetical protein